MSLLPTFSSADDFWPLAAPSVARATLATCVQRAAGRLGFASAALVAWRLERKAIRHLDHVDDRMLADIGITRAEIRRAVAQGRRTIAARDGEERDLLRR